MWYKDIYLSEYSYKQKKILSIFTENRFCSNVIYLDYNFPSLYSLQFFIPYIFTTFLCLIRKELLPFWSVPAPGHLERGVGGQPQGLQSTLHGILGPLVSGTQLLFQSNHVGPETALIREAENPAWPGSQVPSGWPQDQVTLGTESADTPKVPRALSTGS